MFTRSAAWYDDIYAWKDYPAEVERLRAIIARHGQAPPATLLDVACGTGRHLELLQRELAVEGVDADPNMLALARRRLPGVRLQQASMEDFDLGRRFDVVTCLFSSIGYMRTIPALRSAIRAMGRHLQDGGLLLVEPWFSAEAWQVGRLDAILVDKPDLKLARIARAERSGELAVLDLHYLVGTGEGVNHLLERHELRLTSEEEYRAAFAHAGLAVAHDPEGIDGRGLYIARRSAI